MECPHCGFVMDAFAKECPRCKQLDKTGQAPVRSTTAAQATTPVRAASTTTIPKPSRTLPPPATTGFPAHIASIIGAFGAVLVLLGIFLPYRYIPKFGNTISIFQIGENMSGSLEKLHGFFLGAPMTIAGVKLFAVVGMVAWIIAILVAVGGIIAALLNRAVGLWVAGALSTMIALSFIGGYFYTMTIRSIHAKFSYADIQLGFGPILLLVGAIFLLTAAALPHPAEE